MDARVWLFGVPELVNGSNRTDGCPLYVSARLTRIGGRSESPQDEMDRTCAGDGCNHDAGRLQEEGSARAASATTAAAGTDGIVDGDPRHDPARSVHHAELEHAECDGRDHRRNWQGRCD